MHDVVAAAFGEIEIASGPARAPLVKAGKLVEALIAALLAIWHFGRDYMVNHAVKRWSPVRARGQVPQAAAAAAAAAAWGAATVTPCSAADVTPDLIPAAVEEALAGTAAMAVAARNAMAAAARRRP